jgi:probable HAF family extracellular repeat protein
MRAITLLSAGCAMMLGLSACTEERNPIAPPDGPSLSSIEVSSCGFQEFSYLCVRYPNGDSVDITGVCDHMTVVDMNSAGDIALSCGKAGIFHAVLWSKGELHSLPELDGDGSFATDINPRGQVVGYADTQTELGLGYHAVLWEKLEVTDLGTLGGCCSAAYSIDPSGQVFGTSYNAAGELRAFAWKNGVMTDQGPAAF